MTDVPSRDPLAQSDVQAALARRGLDVPFVRVVAETGSTNADAVDLIAAGEPLPMLVTTDLQVTGRGRLDRVWVTPPGAAVLMSVATRPGVPLSSWGWLPLLTGVAVVRALRSQLPAEVGERIVLKWPNDVMVRMGDGDGCTLHKLAGILAERAGDDCAVVGIGLNVDQGADELPIATATSLRALGAPPVDRAELIAEIVDRLLGQVQRWVAASGDAERCGLADDYRALCATLGQSVEVRLPAGLGPVGRATSVSGWGELVVTTVDGEKPVSAGDVVHVIPGA